MKRPATIAAVLVCGAAGLGAAAPAHAAPAKAEVMVAGSTAVLAPARAVTLRNRRVKVGGRRCAVGGRTPLAALLGTRLDVRLHDYGRCGRRPADASSLYVQQVQGERAKGRDGWVYKVGRRVGTAAAGDPGGPFGNGGVRAGQRVLWFWCESGASGCQRTLEVRAQGAPRAGTPLRVTVRGYDDFGRGTAVTGATVSLSGETAVTGSNGTALVTPGARPARGWILSATRAGMVGSFPEPL